MRARGKERRVGWREAVREPPRMRNEEAPPPAPAVMAALRGRRVGGAVQEGHVAPGSGDLRMRRAAATRYGRGWRQRHMGLPALAAQAVGGAYGMAAMATPHAQCGGAVQHGCHGLRVLSGVSGKKKQLQTQNDSESSVFRNKVTL